VLPINQLGRASGEAVHSQPFFFGAVFAQWVFLSIAAQAQQ
jgi:hypothetical protein